MVFEADKTRYESMQYRRCGQSGLRLPAVSLGLWHNFGDSTLIENSRQLLQRAFELGITHFDLAKTTTGHRQDRQRATLDVFFGKIFTLTVTS